jgi:hypothetical protein
MPPRNANFPIGGVQNAIQENGVPRDPPKAHLYQDTRA